MPDPFDAEALLNSVLNALPDAVITITEEGLIASYSHAAERMLGYEASEVIGQNVKMLMPAPYQDEHDGYIDHYKTTHQKKIIGIGRDVEAQRKDGTVLPIHLSVSEMFVQDRRMFTGIIRDQSELKQAENRTGQFAQIVEDSVSEIYISNADTYQVTHANSAARLNLGYSADEIPYLKAWDFVKGRDRDNIEILLGPLRKGTKDWQEFEAIQIRKNGTTYPVRTQLQLLRTKEQPVFVEVVQDLSELTETEAARRQFASIVEHSVNEIYISDAKTLRILNVNQTAHDNLGYSLAELREFSPRDYLVDFDQAQAEKNFNALITSEKKASRFESWHRRKDGSKYPVEVQVKYMGDQLPPVFVATVQDITERYEQIEKLKLRDRAIFEVHTGVLITDAADGDNPIIYVNRAMEEMTGYTAQEMMGKDPRFLQGEDRNQPGLENIRMALKNAVPVQEILRNYRKDGSRTIVEVIISPIRDDLGKVTHFIGVQSDVTSKLDMEERLRQSQKMDAIGQLTGGIAHDFNNMLTVIIGNNELLADRLNGDDFVVSLLNDASSAAESGAQLTSQLLSFARQQVLDPKAIDLNKLIRDLGNMLDRTLGETINQNMKLEDGLGRPFADPSQVHNALLNLAINARDAMPNGGDLTIETSTMDFDADMASGRDGLLPGRYARLTVSDTGIGMSPEIQSRILEPFFTTKEKGEGTGLGLSMVHGFAKQSGGHLEIYSELGHGTTVSLYLPNADGLEVGASDSRNAASPLGKGAETILVVEDDARVRKTTINRLEHLGYEILQAEAGQQALDILAENSGVDLVFTDMVMPGGMSGAELVVEVHKLYPHIKCIITSGYAEQDTIPSDGTLWLRKPYKLLQMSQLFRQLLD